MCLRRSATESGSGLGIQGWKGVQKPLRGRKTLLEASIIVTVSSPPGAQSETWAVSLMSRVSQSKYVKPCSLGFFRRCTDTQD